MSLSDLPLPKSYVCYRLDKPIEIDGRLDDEAWQSIPWTDDFVDIEGDKRPKPRFKTRAKMGWDDRYLYIGAEMEEPMVWATLTAHDSVIFHDHDFEVFIDPDNDGCFYTEMEMNALNTTWDLLLPRAYRGGGPALDGFELVGMRTAVHIDGELNRPDLGSKGWSTEIAIPWQAFKDIARTHLPPEDREQWRINFSRVEWHTEVVDGKIRRVPGTKEDNWVWSPIGVVDMHWPEQWGILQFSTLTGGAVTVDPSPSFMIRRKLVEAWEAQNAYRRAHDRWATTAEELGDGFSEIKVYAGLHHFELELQGRSMDESLRFWKA